MIEVTFENDLAIINLGNNENRLHPAYIKSLHGALDKVLENEEISALICTASGKFFSNGLDLQHLGNLTPQELEAFWYSFFRALLRILCFPMPTICAINGHAFAGGCFLSLAFDYRVMRGDKCWISANEVYMPSRVPEFLMHFIREKLPTSTQRIQILALGKRFTADEALRQDIVQAIAPIDSLMDKAKEVARERLKYGQLPRIGCSQLKLDLYRDLINRLDNGHLMDPMPEIPPAKL